ncbi:2-hydroxyacyl-CoA dehydratase family protein [Novosphingobium sp.]|uniref:2-hydroxyacyl-CoA dehydratase family protein n=1 Tax=Novosphingobium sp. TaxID=1874826 RepID=UPI0031D0724E
MIAPFLAQPEPGARVIRTLGFDAPRALLLACGFQPMRLVAPIMEQTPRADAIMGTTAMSPRGRALLEILLDEALAETPILITAADSEQAGLYAALRELARQGEPTPKHIHFLDLLHMDRPSSQAYSAKRLAQLQGWLIALGGHAPEHLAEIASLLARQTVLIDALAPYRAAGRLSGSDALTIIASAAILPPAQHIAALETLLATLPDAPILPGKRVLVCGTPHENDTIYRAIEAQGHLIVGEDHPWGVRFPHGPIPPLVEDSGAPAARLATLTQATRPEAILHIAIGGDEAAPWDIAALRKAVPNVPFTTIRCPAHGGDKLAAALRSEPAPTKPQTAPKAPRAASPPPPRSRKSLTSVASFNAYQRDWFAGIRAAVADGSPFAMVNANAPQEILRALDIPFVVNQWWASIVAAKQQSRRYQGLLRAHHYPSDVEAYSAQGLAAHFDEDADNAPWGGLPHPDFLHAVASSEPTAKIFANWGRESGAQTFVYEKTSDPRPDLYSDWWRRLPDQWDSALEEERIDLMTEELRAVIASLEQATGRRFDAQKFRAVMDLVNEQEGYYRATRDLVARTVPAPIGVVDSMPATMVPQWHRGTVWARNAARAFYEEVKARVDAGLAACAHEKIRLLWLGRGLWSDMGFYQKWEESHGAVFVWSMYLALAADGYIRDLSGGRDPLRALASRCITMGDELRMPTWAGPWYVHEADTHAVDGVVALSDADPFVVRALQAAGYPVLQLTTDNFNREGEDAAATDAAITAFIEGPAAERSAQRLAPA